jgi:trimeric autotransporter adhesin
MKNNFFKKWLALSALFAFMCFSPHALLRAQSTANYAFTTNTSGSLVLDMNGNAVDMSSGTTQLVASDLDDNSSSATAIGFTFQLMANPYTQFVASSNGIIQLGASALSTTAYTLAGSVASPRIGALAADLRTGSTGKVHYKLVGTAPNRCLVVEFLNMSLTYVGSPGSNDGTYQVRLYETTGVVEFVYGPMFRNASTTSASAIFSGFSVGGAANNQASVTTATNTVSTGATFDANSYTNSANIPNLHSPVEGSRRVYRFTPPVPAAPTSLTFTTVGSAYMNLNWVDNATNEIGYNIYRSLDGITYTYVTTIAANSVSYFASGLTPSTLYYWNVSAVSEGVISSPVSGSQSTTACTTISGIKTVGPGGDYPSLSTAFADINSCTLSGNTELQLIAGYSSTSEAYPIQSSNTASVGAFTLKVYPVVAGLSITSNNATGTLNLNNAKNITIDGRVNQAGANDLIIANTNAGASYAILLNNDASNNVIQNCIVQSTNTSSTSGTIVFAGSTGTTGNDNNLIDHCDIKDGASTPTNAIYSAGTSTAIDNSGNTVSNSNIFNYFNAGNNSNGIFLSSNSAAWTINANKFYQTTTRTVTAGSQHRGINVVTSNGNGYVITNNVIGYASSTGTGTTTYNGGFAGRFFGIELTAANTGTASSIQGNTITAISLTTTSGTTTAPGIFTGISVLGGTVSIGNTTPNVIGTGPGTIAVTTSNSANVFGIHANSTGALNILNNVIGGISGTGSVAGASCSITGINVTGSTTLTTINGNTIGGTTNPILSGTSAFTTTSATVSGIMVGSGLTTLAINTNAISDLRISGASGTIYGINSGTTQYTINSNIIHDLAISANSGTSASIIYGIYNLASPTVENITNNQVYNLSVAGATTSTGNIIAGVHTNTTTSTKIFSGNTINGLSFSNSSTGTAVINGISSALGTTVSIFKNKVYNLSASGTGSTVNGVLVSSSSTGTATSTIYNNVIGDLKTPTASAADAIRGISITSTTTGSTYRVYYNSVYLNASSTGTNFGTSGIYHAASGTATTAALDLRNNVIINESAPAGTGISAVFRRSGAQLANFASTSNRNLLYAGSPSATRAIMYDGTTAYQTIAAYQTAVASREVNSFTGEAGFTGTGYGTAGNFFISTTPSSSDYLKPVAGIATQAESGAANITTPAITDDYAAVVRQGNAGYAGTGTAPDLGAFEFEGLPLAPPAVAFNSITPNTQQCAATPRLVSVNVTNTFGSVTGVVINYSINGAAQTPVTMTNTGGTTWEGTIPAPVPGNATITWSVTATNSVALSGSYNGTAYSDEPLTGVAVAAAASSAALCDGNPTTLTATLSNPGTVTIGAGSTNTTSAGEDPFYGGYGGVKTQYLIRASELTAQGLSAGNITQLSMNITSAGSALTGFGISASNTALTVLTTNIENVGTQVYSTASFVPAVGANNFVFSTPLNWDGTSNIILSFCWSNNNTSNTASQITGGTTPFVSGNARYVDSRTAAEVCGYIGNTTPAGWNGAATTVSFRPNFILSGNKAPAIQTISWSDGVGTVGTTNPLTVTPTVTTTYTATITAAGCAVSPSPSVIVTVNPLPGTPTATNSAQCGIQVPTASVTSTSGLPTPTFKWYDAASAGTLLQNSTSTTYTTAISATTTFYVSEVNTVTGCEGARIGVTVTVTTPDAVSASASSASVCQNAAVVLTAVNTNPTPVQTYTYSWSGAAGSGAETPVAGNPATITPTLTGTYTYAVTAVSGVCTTISTVAVTVNPIPTSVVANVNDATICNGEAVNLTSSGTSNSQVSPVTILAQNFDSGLGAWTTTFNGTAPASTGFMIQNAPYTYDGVMDFTNFATPQNGGFMMSNADMGTSGNKTRTTVVSPVFSTVGMANANVTFLNLYQKFASGDSLVQLEISTNGGSTWATLKDYLPLGSQGVTTNNAQVMVNENIALTAPYLNQANVRLRYNYVSAWGFFWMVDDIKVIATPSDQVTYNWASVPTGFTSTVQNPTGAAPAVTTTYTVTLTNSFSCTASASTAVTVNQPTSSSVSDEACITYTWAQNGMTYVASGAYTDTIPNAAGCDSVITLNLTINNSTTATVNHTACQTYTWPINSTTYTTSGIHTATIPNAAGCDSVITLNLTIGGPSASLVPVTNCGPYVWAQTGLTYNTSGAYNDTIPNMYGCDSVITLSLTINQPTTATVPVTECTSYTWAQNGTTYTVSGMYNDTIPNAAGCDSVVTLNLTIVQPTTSTVTVSECTSYTWAQNGTTYTASGMYNDTIPNAAGCDSIITLNLTINSVTTSTVTVSTCNPTYTWAQNGTVYNATGMYNDTITNAAGCDSVVTLNLTIAPFVATATDNGNATITASAGTTYQWINCTTNTAIAGATTQTFTATANGTYAAVVSNGTCSDTTNCVNITNVGIKENTISTISVHPNPTHDFVIVTMDDASAVVEVMDVQGKLVQTTQIKSGDQIDLGAYERGVYTLRIKTESGTSIERIVKN